MSQRVNRRWFWWLTVISIVSLVPPLVWILTWERHAVPTGDSWYFHWQAALIADGAGWFISPGPYLTHHVVVQSALHPPLWVLVLSFADTLGLQSYLSQLLVASVIGAGAVFVTGLAAREVAGPRAGLIAAGIAALYPNYWINDGLGLSETLILLLTAMLILVSFKLWREPSVRKAIALGLLCGLMALTRAEQVLLIVVVLVPLTLLLRGVALRRRLWYGAAGTLAAIAIMAPWLGFNLSRFTNPTLFSNDSGTTLAMANCRPAYRDGYLGSGDFNCLKLIAPVAGDESVQDAHERKAGLHYLNAHLGRLPVVVTPARPAREFGLLHAPGTTQTREHGEHASFTPRRSRLGDVLPVGCRRRIRRLHSETPTAHLGALRGHPGGIGGDGDGDLRPDPVSRAVRSGRRRTGGGRCRRRTQPLEAPHRRAPRAGRV